MKSIRKYFLLPLVAMLAVGLQSCDDWDDDNDWWIEDYNQGFDAVVTIRNVDDKLTFQLNDSVTLYPTNITTNPFGDGEGRAFVHVAVTDTSVSDPGDLNNCNVRVSSLDTIRTKDQAVDYGTENETVYGNDPLEIVNDWITVCEDGYLTLHIYTGFGSKTHIFNLIKVSGDNVYELRQDAQDDNNLAMGSAYIAFRMPDLPATDGKYGRLTLKYNSYSGEKTVTFQYLARN